jgi:enterochelin esterase family protein
MKSAFLFVVTVFLSLIAWPTLGISGITDSDHPALVSPILQKVSASVSQGDTLALKEFWQKIKEKGSPLFENIPGNEESDEVFCTFLYKPEGDIQVTRVFLSISYFFPWRNLKNWMMDSLDLGEERFWYKTIKVRPDIRTEYRFALNESIKSLEETFKGDYVSRSKQWKLDPYNKEMFIFPKDSEDPKSIEYSVSVLVGPKALPQPYVQQRKNIPTGLLKEIRLSSKVLGSTKRVYVYTPPNYNDNSGPYAFLFVFDGVTYTHTINTPAILDHLIYDRKIPPMVAVFVDDQAGEDSRVEDLSPNEKYPQFLSNELIPWARKHYAITHDSKNSFIAGSSHGGLAATWNAFKNPELFGNVISQSGSFFWYPELEEVRSGKTSLTDRIEPGWLIRQFQESKRLPLRFYLDVGLLENIEVSFIKNNSNLSMNRKMRDTLQAKGYSFKYIEFNGGHEYLWWQETLADGLIELVRMNREL